MDKYFVGYKCIKQSTSVLKSFLAKWFGYCRRVKPCVW